MPIEVVGLREALKAMRKLQPDLEKELKTEIKGLLNPIVKEAKSYVPTSIAGLSNWTFAGSSNKINAQTSMFRVGRFPKFNAAAVRAGIKAEVFPSKPNLKGFVSLVRIVNQSAAGAIYETAGRAHPDGQPWNKKSGSHRYSHSLNPDAGRHFVHSLIGPMAGEGKTRGRLIYRAWNQNQGRAIGAVMAAIEKTAVKTKNYVDAAAAFRKAA